MPEAMLPARGLGRNGGVPSATASASHDMISGRHLHRCIRWSSQSDVLRSDAPLPEHQQRPGLNLILRL